MDRQTYEARVRILGDNDLRTLASLDWWLVTGADWASTRTHWTPRER